ncbi:MAG TPA: hypothetical protein VJW20_04585 [Candidatus Angelobacter sp.]|nr:hypothetical protein [Candidatus Angelobacter sp.]
MKFAVIAYRHSHLHSSVKNTLTFFSHQKFPFTLATAAALLILAGCGGVNANSTPPPSPTPTATPVTTPTPAPSTVNIPTWHMNNARTGLNDQETLLTPANVSGGSFGKLFSYAVDGYVYAQPLYISNLSINGSSHNVVFVATEMATVYAFDADNFGDGSPLWKTSLLQSGESPQPGGNPQPFQGLTSTPVIDTGSNTMYLVSSQKSTGAPFFRLHAIDITTGKERAGSPVVIHASVPGTNSESVNGVINLTVACLQRASLLLSQGTLFIGFSACPTGWLLSYDAASLSQIAVLNMSPDVDGYGEFGGAGGVWLGGGGPAADDAGNVYVSTGNGPFDDGPEWGDSILKLDSHLHIIDHFTPSDWAFLQCRDLDVSAGGIMLVPGESQLVAGGKAGKMYLINTANLGQLQPNDAGALQTLFFSPGSATESCVDNHGNTVTGQAGTSSFYGTPAWFNGSFFVGNDPGPVKAFTYNSSQITAAGATPQSIAAFSYGTTPFVSANGTDNGIVWVLDHGKPIQDPHSSTPASATLRAYDATNISRLLYSSAQNAADTPGFGIKFTEPIVANGKVFMATAHDSLSTASPQGELDVYGLKQ